MVNASVHQPGTIVLHNVPFRCADAGTIYARGLANYEFSSPESLFKVAARHDYIIRANGNKQKGADYTLAMAVEDYNILSDINN